MVILFRRSAFLFSIAFGLAVGTAQGADLPSPALVENRGVGILHCIRFESTPRPRLCAQVLRSGEFCRAHAVSARLPEDGGFWPDLYVAPDVGEFKCKGEWGIPHCEPKSTLELLIARLSGDSRPLQIGSTSDWPGFYSRISGGDQPDFPDADPGFSRQFADPRMVDTEPCRPVEADVSGGRCTLPDVSPMGRIMDFFGK